MEACTLAKPPNLRILWRLPDAVPLIDSRFQRRWAVVGRSVRPFTRRHILRWRNFRCDEFFTE